MGRLLRIKLRVRQFTRRHPWLIAAIRSFMIFSAAFGGAYGFIAGSRAESYDAHAFAIGASFLFALACLGLATLSMRLRFVNKRLRTLATHPVDYLVVPRITAVVLTMPLLTAESIAVGIGAGYALAVCFLGVEAGYTWHHTVNYTTPEHALMGLIKSVIYGLLIGLICCYKGMNCREGAEGVGRATTEAVVYSSITVLVSNFFLTLFLNRALGSA